MQQAARIRSRWGAERDLGSKALWLFARVHYGQLVPGGLAPGKSWGMGRASQQGEFISFSEVLHAAQAAGRRVGAACAQGGAAAVWRVLACAWVSLHPRV